MKTQSHEPYESGEALELDEAAMDRVWEVVRCKFPNYQATPDEIAHLAALPQRRAVLYARMPSWEERQRRATELRRRLLLQD